MRLPTVRFTVILAFACSTLLVWLSNFLIASSFLLVLEFAAEIDLVIDFVVEVCIVTGTGIVVETGIVVDIVVETGIETGVNVVIVDADSRFLTRTGLSTWFGWVV